MADPGAIHEAVSRNPACGTVLARYPYENAEQMEGALARAQLAYRRWSTTDMQVRVAVLQRMAQVLRERIEPMAAMAACEMGKPIRQARAEVEKCASLCEWYAEHGPAMVAPEATRVPGDKAWIHYRPIGSILAIMPWNFPLWQVMRGAVPILLSGNGYVLKHAPNCMGCAYLLSDAWRDAGLADGVFEVINVTPQIASVAIDDPRIAAVTVTGSVGAGSAVAAQAGRALKKCVLELGGSDAFIVLADADIDAAVQAAVAGRFQNTGQVCIAAKRIIVADCVMDAFTEKFVAAVAALEIGDPMEERTYIGPMARADLREEMHAQVQATIAQGARLLLGGQALEGQGNYYRPTVLGEVTADMTSFREEVFGPVASLIRCRDADHALELANDSAFGLAGNLWSADVDKAQQFAARLETGGVFINGFSASDPRVPIGGVKKSGFGRELSRFGMQEFMNTQTVWVDHR